MTQIQGKISTEQKEIIKFNYIEWEKGFSLDHTANLSKGWFFENHEEALNKKSENENAYSFFILDLELEHLRSCFGHFHFKLF